MWCCVSTAGSGSMPGIQMSGASIVVVQIQIVFRCRETLRSLQTDLVFVCVTTAKFELLTWKLKAPCPNSHMPNQPAGWPGNTIDKLQTCFVFPKLLPKVLILLPHSNKAGVKGTQQEISLQQVQADLAPLQPAESPGSRTGSQQKVAIKP